MSSGRFRQRAAQSSWRLSKGKSKAVSAPARSRTPAEVAAWATSPAPFKKRSPPWRCSARRRCPSRVRLIPGECTAMGRKFDLVLIGTGSAASTVASKCRSAGWQVAVVDSRPFGGTCALRGCDPKKVLVGAAALIDWLRRMNGRGVHGNDARIDWSELMRFKRTFTDPVPKQREESFAKAG